MNSVVSLGSSLQPGGASSLWAYSMILYFVKKRLEEKVTFEATT